MSRVASFLGYGLYRCNKVFMDFRKTGKVDIRYGMKPCRLSPFFFPGIMECLKMRNTAEGDGTKR